MTKRKLLGGFKRNMNPEDSDLVHRPPILSTVGPVTITELRTPAEKFRPKLFIDGNQWCALYGENLQDGVAGFGKSPQKAMNDFDKAFTEELKEE